VRAAVRAQSLPAEVSDELKKSVMSVADRLPQIAEQFGIDPATVPKRARKRAADRRPPKKGSAGGQGGQGGQQRSGDQQRSGGKGKEKGVSAPTPDAEPAASTGEGTRDTPLIDEIPAEPASSPEVPAGPDPQPVAQSGDPAAPGEPPLAPVEPGPTDLGTHAVPEAAAEPGPESADTEPQIDLGPPPGETGASEAASEAAADATSGEATSSKE